jgi:hypothetical protein
MKGCVESGGKDCERDCPEWVRDDCVIYQRSQKMLALCAGAQEVLRLHGYGASQESNIFEERLRFALQQLFTKQEAQP